MKRQLPVPFRSKCYACDANATTWEHAPPRAFYPKPSQLGPFETAKNYRTNLIKVPSCTKHNNSKSKGDSYAVGVIAALTAVLKVPGLPPGRLPPFFQEWIERLSRGRRFSKTFFQSPRTARILGPDGQEQVEITIDAKSIDETIEFAARALYHHHHNLSKRWAGECIVRNLHTLHSGFRPPENADTFASLDHHFATLERRGDPRALRRGPHPDVFFYQLIESESGTIGMRLVFYRYFTFIALRRATDEKPAPSEKVAEL